ncbi:hypothetical protein VTO73DRAFT_3871 [Trametes versicolor]
MPPTARFVEERLRVLLSEAVKAQQYSIVYRDLMYRIRPRVLRSCNTAQSPFRRMFVGAIAEEVYHNRIVLDVPQFPPRIRVTDTGRAFYSNYAEPPPTPRRARARRLRRVGILRKSAINEYAPYAEVLEAIRKTICTRDMGENDASTVEEFPRTVRALLETQQTLRAENDALMHDYNNISNEIEELRERVRNVMGHDVSSSDEEDA